MADVAAVNMIHPIDVALRLPLGPLTHNDWNGLITPTGVSWTTRLKFSKLGSVEWSTPDEIIFSNTFLNDVITMRFLHQSNLEQLHNSQHRHEVLRSRRNEQRYHALFSGFTINPAII